MFSLVQFYVLIAYIAYQTVMIVVFQTTTLTVQRQDLKACDGSDDTLKVFDGQDEMSTEILSTCGSHAVRTLTSTGDALYIKFTTYRKRDEHNNGIKLTWGCGLYIPLIHTKSVHICRPVHRTRITRYHKYKSRLSDV